MKTQVVIVGAGPSGLSTSACLNLLSIPNIILEREDCCSSLWKKRSYDRVTLHLAKQFCQLPHMPHPSSTPTFIPKKQFIQYLDDYVAQFNLCPRYCRSVQSTFYDDDEGQWRVASANTRSGDVEEYIARFLVVATGENCHAFIPDIPGLDGFEGEVLHSSQYKSGVGFDGKDVLVVGSGNSGMEIAFDLCNYGAMTSIVIRSPLHLLSREITHVGLLMSKWLPLHLVDRLLVLLSKFKYGDLSKYGITRPEKGPFYLELKHGKYPVINTGTSEKIKSGGIKVLPSLISIEGNDAVCADGVRRQFDTIIFATGYKSKNNWIKDDDNLIGKDGLPKPSYPNHWKGRRGLYCVGLPIRGLYGLAIDAQNVADDIQRSLQGNQC